MFTERVEGGDRMGGIEQLTVSMSRAEEAERPATYMFFFGWFGFEGRGLR